MICINTNNYDHIFNDIVNKVCDNAPCDRDSLIALYNLVKDAFMSRPTTSFFVGKEKEYHAEEFMEHYLRMARIIVFNIQGTFKEAALCFVLPALIYGLVTEHTLRKNYNAVFSEARRISDIVLLEHNEHSILHCNLDVLITKHIYSFACGSLYEALKRKLKHGRMGMVDRAYRLAKDAHEGQNRKSGEPYIAHPLMVANILADMNTESEIVAAGLLHDVIEDSRYTYNDIAEKIGRTVAQYVEAVTSLDKELEKKVEANPQGVSISFDKDEIDKMTVNKLSRMASENDDMIYALYIKVADRIHNLRTIDEMSNQNKKINETIGLYIPLLKRFKLMRFASILEDECWRVNDPERYIKIASAYERLLLENRNSTDGTWDKLDNIFKREMERYYRRFSCNGFSIELREKLLLPYEVFSLLKNKTKSFNKIDTLISKQNMSLMIYEVIVDSLDSSYDLSTFIQIFMEIYREALVPAKRVITDFKLEYFNDKQFCRYVVSLADEFHNEILLQFYFRESYYASFYGDNKGIVEQDKTIEKNEKEISHVIREEIIVKKKNGESMHLPKGASVLDFAFSLHQDLGLSAYGALVNGREADLYHLLSDGDYVVIKADTSLENGERKDHIDHARVDWLNHVVTDYAKGKIIRYLESKYEGQNPRSENRARQKFVTVISNAIYSSNINAMSAIAND